MVDAKRKEEILERIAIARSSHPRNMLPVGSDVEALDELLNALNIVEAELWRVGQEFDAIESNCSSLVQLIDAIKKREVHRYGKVVDRLNEYNR